MSCNALRCCAVLWCVKSKIHEHTHILIKVYFHPALADKITSHSLWGAYAVAKKKTSSHGNRLRMINHGKFEILLKR